jgi:hypothetical protein
MDFVARASEAKRAFSTKRTGMAGGLFGDSFSHVVILAENQDGAFGRSLERPDEQLVGKTKAFLTRKTK